MPYPRIPPSGAINHGRLRGRQSLEEELRVRRFQLRRIRQDLPEVAPARASSVSQSGRPRVGAVVDGAVGHATWPRMSGSGSSLRTACRTGWPMACARSSALNVGPGPPSCQLPLERRWCAGDTPSSDTPPAGAAVPKHSPKGLFLAGGAVAPPAPPVARTATGTFIAHDRFAPAARSARAPAFMTEMGYVLDAITTECAHRTVP